MRKIGWIVRLVAEEYGAIEGARVGMKLLGLDASLLDEAINDQPRDTGGCFSDVEGAICTHKNLKSGNGQQSQTNKNASGENKPHTGSGPADEKEIREAAKNPVINRKGMARHANKAAAEKAMRDEQSRCIQEDKKRIAKGLRPRRIKVPPKSYFTVDQNQAVRQIIDKLRKGDFYVYTRKDGSVHYQVDLGYLIGKTYDGNVEIDTYTATVLYSRKEGFHFCPTKLVQDRRKANT